VVFDFNSASSVPLAISSVSYLAVDNKQDLYLSDDNCIYKINSNGVAGVVGSCGLGQGRFRKPSDIAIDNLKNVYVLDSGNYLVQKFSSDGSFITQWGGKGSGNSLFFNPTAITADSKGYVYILDSGNIKIFKDDGTYIATIMNIGGAAVVDPDNNFLVVRTIMQYNNYISYIYKYDQNWQLLSSTPLDVKVAGKFVVDEQGSYYFSGDCIRKFDANGKIVFSSYGNPDNVSAEFSSVSVDSSGYLYAVDSANNLIQQLDSNGNFIQSFGSQGFDENQFQTPVALAISSDIIGVVDKGNNRVVVYKNPNVSKTEFNPAILQLLLGNN
jgi:hypothetical protein